MAIFNGNVDVSDAPSPDTCDNAPARIDRIRGEL
jgi:hypothetical protein